MSSAQAQEDRNRIQSTLIHPGPDGKLVYQADALGDKVPDFSGAGYGGGGVALPQVPVKVTVTAQEGDDTASIQAAIDKVSAMPLDENGFRGAVLLKAGQYDISDTLRIAVSGVVVRGDGAGSSGTVIVHRGTAQKNSFYIQSGDISSEKVTGIAGSYVPVGAKRLRVENSDGLAAGQMIVLVSTPTQKWIDALKMTGSWKPEDFVLRWVRRIEAMNAAKNEIVLDGPVTSQIDQGQGYAAGEVQKVVSDKRISHVGFENIVFVSEYDLGKKDAYGYFNDEQHANIAIHFSNAVDCWMQHVVGFFYWGSLVRTRGTTTRVTVQDCAMLDGVSLDTPRVHSGSKKYYFDTGSASQVLVQRCYGRYARHAFIMNGHGSTNVILDCYSEKGHLAPEPHQRWQNGSLFDNVYSDSMLKLNRSDDATAAHGQRAANCVLWNCTSNSYRDWEPEIHLDKPINNLGQNWVIGAVLKGKGQGIASPSPETKFSDKAYIELTGQPVTPRSLYLAQLQDRLGRSAVEAVTTLSQRTDAPQVFSDLLARYSHIPEYGNPYDLSWMPAQFGLALSAEKF